LCNSTFVTQIAKLLHEKRVAEAADRADIVVLGIQGRDRSVRLSKEVFAGGAGAAQLW